MNRQLIEVVAQYVLFLEHADDSQIPLETAVRQQEDLAARLQQMSLSERAEFVQGLLVIAEGMESADDREILRRLPDEVGIT